LQLSAAIGYQAIVLNGGYIVLYRYTPLLLRGFDLHIEIVAVIGHKSPKVGVGTVAKRCSLTAPLYAVCIGIYPKLQLVLHIFSTFPKLFFYIILLLFAFSVNTHKIHIFAQYESLFEK
jgi:hypothetical protein